MVLVEVEPEDVILREGEHESDFETDSNPESDAVSSDDDDDFSPTDETLYERLAALKDIVPPQTRSKLSKGVSQTKAWTWWSLQSVGNVAWWVSTSALLVGLPLALAIEDETRVVQQEREMQMQSQGQQQLLGGGQQGQSGVLPPGF
ncbi:mitochondrial outer membrane translocase complex, subunit Tom22 [Naematelia encephala]|uniref:Mitochondrial outer membrane translocase complex, subunit Tom22 n=1 Tax=Naematelia encephala TaxID=71784 RepID=A0A1Y2AE40_9TREE|nr:mitochondrial outer membrane translocase complex, subunit Tom22 [Naematelia encephala]